MHIGEIVEVGNRPVQVPEWDPAKRQRQPAVVEIKREQPAVVIDEETVTA